jgi:hypothetical protein
MRRRCREMRMGAHLPPFFDGLDFGLVSFKFFGGHDERSSYLL